MQLYDATMNALVMATDLGCKSISIPAISSGIFGFPVPLCAQVIFSAVHDYVKEHVRSGKQGLLGIRLVNWDQPTTQTMMTEFIFICQTSQPSLEFDVCRDNDSF